MRPTPNQPVRRGGFTLVELLVVITIIAILFALTAAAVSRAMIKMDETKTRNDISQLQGGVQAFKTDFSVAYIPDRLVLPPGNDPASLQYISSLWPRINPGALSAGNTSFLLNGQTYTPYTYWRVPSNQPIVLQGYQTIVFFLGGSWDPTAGYASDRLGFSTNPTDPMSVAGQLGAANRKGPYFEFPTARLQVLASDQSKTPQNPFPAFIDVYGTMPYVYFSGGKAGNDYASTYNSTNFPNFAQNGSTSAGSYFSMLPFQISNSRFANANGFQIIAAGRDTLFHDQTSGKYGGGTFWPGFAGGATDQSGYDNMSNFHQTLLGIAAN
jgi:prepilin-type N-terminal cleavage/methylation domain-containing protein